MGDVYAALVESYYSQKQNDKAFSMITAMKQRRLNITYYIDVKTLTAIYKAVGAAVDFSQGGNDADEIKEDIRIRK